MFFIFSKTPVTHTCAAPQDTIWETDDLKEYQRIKSMEEQLRSILSIAFSVGFLKLERITWHSPASLLEKIAAFEAVHPVINWLDLKTRVGHQRRCYAFIHPSLPDSPLVFVHVALTDSIAPAISVRICPLGSKSRRPAPL